MSFQTQSCRPRWLMLSFVLCCLFSISAPRACVAEGGSGGMMRYPDVSATHIVFVYSGDLWTVPKAGGNASPLASPPGAELNPRFSADGSEIAFVGNYDGGSDIYVCPTAGGLPRRMTYHPSRETLCDWTPDGGLLYFSNAFTGLGRMTHLMTVSDDQPYPVRLPVPYGTNGSISGDGSWLAYTPYSRDTRTWKRYRGGMASDVWLYNLKTNRSKQISDWEGTDTLPMWHGETGYYLSDAGPNSRLNIWSYDTNSGERQQVTKHDDYDVKWPSIGPGNDGEGEIVYQQGASIKLLNLESGKSTAVEIQIPGARPRLRPQLVDAAKFVGAASISPSGKRVAVEARGDIWSVPAKNGAPRNLTTTSGIAERFPAWSPDGQWIAYFSDATGEYELTLTQSDGRGETRRLTNDGTHWRSDPVWSPDSKFILFVDKTGSYMLHTVDGGETVKIFQDPAGETGPVSWSSDSRWLAYSRSADSALGNGSIWVYNVPSGESQQLTSGYFNDSHPAFDRKGDFLYFQSNRRFSSPDYEDVGESFIYQDTGVLLALPLRSDVKNPLLKSIDKVEWDGGSDKKSDEENDDAGDSNDESAVAGQENGDGETEQGTAPEASRDPISGTWSMTVNSSLVPEEARNVTMVLTLDEDGSLSGELMTPGGSIALESPSFDASSKVFTATVQTPIGEAALKATVSGDQMEGTATVSIIGAELPFTAERPSEASGDEDSESAEADSGDKTKSKDKKEAKEVKIEFDGAEQRVIPLGTPPGRYRGLMVNSRNQLVYTRSSSGASSTIFVLDISDHKATEKSVVSGGGSYELSADGKKMLLMRGGLSITEPAAGKGPGKTVSTSGMTVLITPRDEWKQMVVEAWRYQRDFFYDPNMHGVDWQAVRQQYLKLLDDASSRADVGFIIAEMISELNVGHAYYRGVALDDDVPSSSIPVLGCELIAESGRYKITQLWEGGIADTDAQNPLRVAGVKQGQFLLEVEGRSITTDVNPFQLLTGLSGKLIEIVVSDDAKLDDEDARIAVTLPRDDSDLRFRHWIEANRAYVDEKTGGKVGYIFVTNTGQPGQNDLFRQFYAQAGREALIIDERWNGGGQIPTRFIELLNRPVTNYWARRDSRDWVWPPDSHQGPKCMLINGMSGSGGDMFPALFKQNKIGKLIGRRTWGGLVGIQGNLGLLDGASVTVPSFAYYETDGTWGIEGHGVDPDIEVIDDPARMTDGGDPQLDAAIDHMLQQIEAVGFKPAKRPEYPRREKMGLPKADY